MLNYKSSLIEDKKYSGLSIKEISPVMKLNLRGKSREFLSTIGKNINMILPIEANTSSSSDKYTSMWLSPDEWMMISNNVIGKENNNYEIEDIGVNENNPVDYPDIGEKLAKEIASSKFQRGILFCGTGAIGLEALSRGADFCHFIDNSREAKRLTLQNVRNLGAEQNSMFTKTDILDLNQNYGVVSDVVFLDPPYGKNIGTLAISLLLENDWVDGDTIFILEKEVNGQFSSELTIVDQRVYGGTEILILKYENVLNSVDLGNSIQER